MSSGVIFFDAAAAGYAAVFFVSLFGLVLKKRGLCRMAQLLLVVAFLAQTVGLVLRGLALGGFPVTNTYESLVFYGWVFALGYLALLPFRLLADRLKDTIGLFVALLAAAFMLLASSPLRSPEIVPLVPALRSHWLALHVSLVFIGEGFFTISFVAGLLYLVQTRRQSTPEQEERLERLDRVIYQTIAIGFPFFTLGGLFFGAIWAKHAWGRYWGWDPKETFMLVTWLVYVLYLHVRLMRGWRGTRTAWIAVLGFLLALFTFAGVNFLLRGLHSYV